MSSSLRRMSAPPMAAVAATLIGRSLRGPRVRIDPKEHT